MLSNIDKKPAIFINHGFTLIEILLAVAILSIMMGIVIIAINPTHQLSMARDSQRKNDVVQLRKAIVQHFIDSQDYGVKVPTDDTIYEGCVILNGVKQNACGAYVDLTKLTPDYIPDVPRDPLMLKTAIGTGYNIAINAETGVYVEAPNTENGIGEKKTIIFDGRPPRGYEIPIVGGAIEEKSHNFTDRVKEAVVVVETNITDWLKIVGIGSIIILSIGYLIRRRMARKYRTVGSSLLN